MDPVAALALASKCVRKLRGLAQASDDVMSLVNEISDFSSVLTQVIVHHQHVETLSDEAAKQSQVAVRGLLRRAEGELVELHDYVQRRFLRSNGTQDAKVNRVAWLTNKEQITRMRQSIRSIRSDLTLAIGTANSHALTRVELAVQAISSSNMAGYALLQQILHHQALHSVIAPSAVSALSNKTAEDAPGQNQASSSQRGIPHPQDRPTLGGETIPSGLNITTTAALSQPTCTEWCNCACHGKRTYQHPSWLRALFGALFVGYAGLPVLTPACTEYKCRRRSAPSVEVTYSFPNWFLSRVLSVHLRLNRIAGPEFTLRTSRIVDYGAPLWRDVNNGNLHAVQMLFSAGKASPYDVNPRGQSALHYAAINGYPELCRMLVQQNADIHLRCESGMRPIDEAWYLVLSKLRDQTTSSEMSATFYDTDYFESRQFSLLHKILLEMVPGSLEAQLELSTAQVNVQDGNGMTCLAWACARGDANAARVLLANGADPDLIDSEGNQALVYAMISGSFPCVEMLLASCSSHGHLDGFHNLALMQGVYSNHIDAVRLLLKRGELDVDVNTVDTVGETALHVAAGSASAMMVGLLLDAGADPTVLNVFGDAPAHIAMKRRNLGALEKMTEYDVDLSLVDGDGWSLLHLAAFQCTPEVLRILSGAKSLAKVDPLSADNQGRNCFDLVATGNPEEVHQRRELFDQFLGGIRRIHGEGGYDSDGGQEFEDALEYHDS